MKITSSSPRSCSPKRWAGGSSPVMTPRFGAMRGAYGGVPSKSSHLSKPPHLPHPRSRSLDTALDKASDSSTPIADSNAPNCGSVAGSLTDSTMPDSVATDTEMMAASDTDASDSGIFNRYNYTKSSNKNSNIKRSNSKSGLKSKVASSDEDVQRYKIRPKQTESHKPPNSKVNSKSPRQNFIAPSEKDKTKKNSKPSDSISKPSGTTAKSKLSSVDLNKTPPVAKKTFDALRISEKPATELDPYNDFYNRKVKPRIDLSKDKPLSSSLNLTSTVNKGSPVKSNSPKRNPYVSPLITSFKNSKSSSTASVLTPKISNNVMHSPVKSPFSPRSSRSSSLPYSGSESIFKFPSPEPSSSERESSTTPVIYEDTRSPFQSSTLPYFSPVKSTNRESPLRMKESSPSRLFPSSNIIRENALEDTSLVEGSHADLVASCEQYLKKEENSPCSDVDSALRSSRRYSLDSLGKTSNSSLRRRLSSIPLDEDFPENASDDWKRSRKTSDASHEMAIFSAIAALSQVGDFSKQSDEDVFPASEDTQSKTSNKSNDSSSGMGDSSTEKILNKNYNSPIKVSQSPANPDSESSGAPTSSLLDKCVSRVKTFIKK